MLGCASPSCCARLRFTVMLRSVVVPVSLCCRCCTSSIICSCPPAREHRREGSVLLSAFLLILLLPRPCPVVPGVSLPLIPDPFSSHAPPERGAELRGHGEESKDTVSDRRHVLRCFYNTFGLSTASLGSTEKHLSNISPFSLEKHLRTPQGATAIAAPAPGPQSSQRKRAASFKMGPPVRPQERIPRNAIWLNIVIP